MSTLLKDLLGDMDLAACEARGFVQGLTRETFLLNRVVQRAVCMNLIILGEAAAVVLRDHTSFALNHPVVPWAGMRAGRNRLVHAYGAIDLVIVWDAVANDLPQLLAHLPALREDAALSLTQRP